MGKVLYTEPTKKTREELKFKGQFAAATHEDTMVKILLEIAWQAKKKNEILSSIDKALWDNK